MYALLIYVTHFLRQQETTIRPNPKYYLTHSTENRAKIKKTNYKCQKKKLQLPNTVYVGPENHYEFIRFTLIHEYKWHKKHIRHLLMEYF